MTKTSVYKLEPFVYDPRFEGFVFGPGAKSVLGFERAVKDFLVDDGELVSWQPRKLQAVWQPLPVAGAVAPFNDYPCLEITSPVFSQRAVNALGSMLEENGELLPLKSDVGEFFAFVCLTKLDALDVERSRMRRLGPDRVSGRVYYYAFSDSQLFGASIFRIPEQPNIYFVTDKFKDRVEQAGLNGLHFIKVWPLPEGSDWDAEETARRRSRSKRANLLGQGLILRFRLKEEKPSVRERKLAVAIKSSLTELLKVETLEDKYWGTIDDSDYEDSEFRIRCTCPDADQLADHIADWLQAVQWDNDVATVKRYGNLYDSRVKQKGEVIRAVNDPELS